MPLIASQKSEAAARRWTYLVIPSVSDVVFITLLFGLSCGALGRLLLRDASIGWHIRNGQQMLLTHQITRTDLFSSTMSGRPWFAWEWLYDVVFAGIDRTLGLNGVVFYTAAIVAATFVLVFSLTMRRGGNLPITVFLLILALGASAVHFLARPHVVSWLLTAVWFELLDSASAMSYRRLLWLPPIMLLWVNVHGGFVLGFLLLAVYLASDAIDMVTHRSQRNEIVIHLKWLGSTTLLVFAASFINPYTYHLHEHVVHYLTDKFLMNHISEFLSPDFHGAAQQCFALLVLIAIIAVGSARRKLSTQRLLVLLFVVYSGFYATRSLPTSALLMTLIIAPVLSQTQSALAISNHVAQWLRGPAAWFEAFGGRMMNLEGKLSGHLWLVIAFGLGLWACAHSGRIGSEPVINAYFDAKRFPVQAAEAIAERKIPGPIFSLDYWGGYLIYRLYPQVQVVADDRHDLYGDRFFKDFLKIVLVQPGWSETLDKLQVNWVLMPPDSTLANMLRLQPGWKIEYEDQTAVLMRRL